MNESSAQKRASLVALPIKIRVGRSCPATGAAILCICLTCFLAIAVRTEAAPPDKYLVRITYDGLPELATLFELDMQIINYRANQLLALVTDAQLAEIRQLAWSYQILDQEPDSRLYYLVYTSTDAEVLQLTPQEQAFPYEDGVWLVKADPEQLDTLVRKGLHIRKLPERVVRPPDSGSEPMVAFTVEGGDESIQRLADQVSRDEIVTHICHLQDNDAGPYCNTWGSRYSLYRAGLQEAAQYIYNRFASWGLHVEYNYFTYGGVSMPNIVATLPGVDPYSNRIYLVTAHYDSMSPIPYYAAPGADDNASGSAGVLEAARVLSQHRFAHTLRFIAFAGEEQGLIGSAHYARVARSRADNIRGVLNFDMIGWDGNGDNRMELHAGLGTASGQLADAMISAIATYNLELVPEKLTYGAADRSDHASFWDQGYPAILAIEDSTYGTTHDFNPYYHSTSDVASNLDIDYATQFVKAVVASLATLAELRDGEPPSATPTATMSGTVIATPTSAFTSTPATPTQTPWATATVTHVLSPTPTPTSPSTGDIIVDDLEAGFQLNGPASGWRESGDSRDVTYNAHAYWTYCADRWYGSDRNNWAQWRPNLPASGQYRVSVYVPYVITGRPDTSQARYEIYYAGGSTVVTVDQNLSSAQWVYLGTWYFNAGTSGYVELEDITGDWYFWYGGQQARKTIKFDAMKFTLLSPSVGETRTPTRTQTPTPSSTQTWTPAVTPTATRTPTPIATVTPTTTVIAPALYTISNPDCDGNYSVCWNSAGGATGYILEEDDNSSFSSPVTVYVGLDTCIIFSGRPPGIYYYRARTVTDAGSSPWSNSRSVVVCQPTATPTLTPTSIPTPMPTPTLTLVAPILYSISNPECDGSYSVCWNAVDGATGYILEEDRDSSFSSPVTVYVGLNTCTAFSGKPAGIYHYRVRAVRGAGSSPWSNVLSIAVCHPTGTPTATSTAIATLAPTLTLTAVIPGATPTVETWESHLYLPLVIKTAWDKR